MIASQNGEIDVVKHVIDLGEDLDVQDDRGYTALMYACRDGVFPIVSLLLSAGANGSISTSFGYSPLLCASQNGYHSVVSLLLETVDVDTQDSDGMTALILATMNNHLETVRVLLEKGADYSITDSSGYTAVMYAVDACNIPMLRLFSCINVPLQYTIHNESCSLLYLASSRQDHTLVQFLLHFDYLVNDLLEAISYHPNSRVESFIEEEVVCIRDTLTPTQLKQYDHILTDNMMYGLSSLLCVYHCYETTRPLSGLVELCTWCLRLYRFLFDRCCPHGIIPYLASIETIVGVLDQSYHQQSSSSLSMMITTKQIKLLFSLIEIYCLCLGDGFCSCSSTPAENRRLFSFLSKNWAVIKYDLFGVYY